MSKPSASIFYILIMPTGKICITQTAQDAADIIALSIPETPENAKTLKCLQNNVYRFKNLASRLNLIVLEKNIPFAGNEALYHNMVHHPEFICKKRSASLRIQTASYMKNIGCDPYVTSSRLIDEYCTPSQYRERTDDEIVEQLHDLLRGGEPESCLDSPVLYPIEPTVESTVGDNDN